MDPEAEATTNGAHATVMCVYEDAMDDPDDTDLPITATRVKNLQKYSNEVEQTPTVVTGEAQIVQDICAAIWSE